ncbi:DUF4249 domain-containing protein [Pseudotenacibaculum haliotis]|uniref:DUF4249 domain-containing protein n=1 Tax=Pseudotenacibaculum haliotis TaxID=1862138 RepID=A0ABW5LTN9_9FLAO
MKKLNIKYIAGLLILAIIGACTDVVNVTVPDGGARLVVEASILWEKGTTGQQQSIKLSRSTAYFASDLDVPVTNAQVLVTNTTSGDQFLFTHQSDGFYRTNSFVPVIGNSYTLEITLDGNTYRATETMMSVTGISSVEQEATSGFDGDQISIKAYYGDPENEKNFYLAEFSPSNIPIVDLEPSDDEFYNGNENFLEYDNENLSAGDVVDIALSGISEGFYNYINLLTSQVGEGGPFQTTPARLKGNCININDANEEVLGFFRLGELDKLSYTIN